MRPSSPRSPDDPYHTLGTASPMFDASRANSCSALSAAGGGTTELVAPGLAAHVGCSASLGDETSEQHHWHSQPATASPYSPHVYSWTSLTGALPLFVCTQPAWLTVDEGQAAHAPAGDVWASRTDCRCPRCLEAVPTLQAASCGAPMVSSLPTPGPFPGSAAWPAAVGGCHACTVLCPVEEEGTIAPDSPSRHVSNGGETKVLPEETCCASWCPFFLARPLRPPPLPATPRQRAVCCGGVHCRCRLEPTMHRRSCNVRQRPGRSVGACLFLQPASSCHDCVVHEDEAIPPFPVSRLHSPTPPPSRRKKDGSAAAWGTRLTLGTLERAGGVMLVPTAVAALTCALRAIFGHNSLPKCDQPCSPLGAPCPEIGGCQRDLCPGAGLSDCLLRSVCGQAPLPCGV
jgi:hypothetical protein